MTSGPSPQSCLDPDRLEADLVLDGPPEVEFNPGIASRIAAKPTAAGVLIRNEAGEVLFIVPKYKPVLDIPGGIVDANESPRSACQREVQEELNLKLSVGRLLIVDWVPQQGVWRDSHQFIFDGGILSEAELDGIAADDDELSGLSFLTLEDAAGRTQPSLLRRLHLAVEAAGKNETFYAEFGRVT